VKPYVQAITRYGPHAVAVLTSDSEAAPGAAPIKVFEELAREALDVRRIRQALVSTLAVASIATAMAIGLSTVVGAYLDARHDNATQQIRIARNQAGLGPGAGSGSLATALRTLEQRKHDGPASVLTLDAISKILPDHTYVTELRIEGQKLRVVGITRDAPSLIGLIEQSGRFSRATFFAPTTRSATDSEERFHIETVIQPSRGPQT
jgi:general secretion pathway protein L